MNGPWTLQPGTDSSSSRRQTFGLWWRQKKRGLLSSTTASAGLLGSRLCLNLNFRICVYLIHEHLAEFWLRSHCLPSIVKPLVFFEGWTTSMFAANICFNFFLVLLRVTFHISAFHHSHTPGILKLETAVMLLFIKDSMAKRVVPETLPPEKSSLNYIPMFTSPTTLNNSNGCNKLLSICYALDIW